MQGCIKIQKSINVINQINIIKDWKFLIDAENEFEKIQALFMIKTLNKQEIEGNFLNLINGICEKSTGTSYLMVKD